MPSRRITAKLVRSTIEKSWSRQELPISQATSRSAKPTAATLSLFPSRVKGLSDHGVFIPCDTCPAGITEIENTIDLVRGFRTSKITCHKAAHIFRQRYTEFPQIPKTLQQSLLPA
jgi:hypothetical protein